MDSKYTASTVQEDRALSLAFKNKKANESMRTSLRVREVPGLAFLTPHTAECPQAIQEGLGRQGWWNPSQLRRIWLCTTVPSELHTDNAQRAADPPPGYYSSMNSVTSF